jgi:hypothetical protein
MMRVQLYTRDGEFVVEGLIPPFLEWPQVILWGSRIFTWYEEVMVDRPGQMGPEMIPFYREAFSVALVLTQDAKEHA